MLLRTFSGAGMTAVAAFILVSSRLRSLKSCGASDGANPRAKLRVSMPTGVGGQTSGCRRIRCKRTSRRLESSYMPHALLIQPDLWDLTETPFLPTPRRKRKRKARSYTHSDEPLAYPDRRQRRCVHCNEWFRPPTSRLPEHKDRKGKLCLGSKRFEQAPKPARYPDWREDAACEDMDSRTFWVEEDGPTANKAIAICKTCPAIDMCWLWANRDKDFAGVAGGALWNIQERRTRGK